MTIKAFFDESGIHHGSPVLSVAGFASDTDQWLEFANEWKRIVADFGLYRDSPDNPINFSFSDVRGTRHEVFSTWESTKHIEFMRRVVSTIGRRVRRGFSSSIDVATYKRLVLDPIEADGFRPSDGVFSPYSLCLADCLKSVAEWLEESGHHDGIQYHTEMGPFSSDAGRLFDAMRPEDKRRYRFHAHTNVNKGSAEIYAADLIAYEGHKHWKNALFSGGSSIPLRRSLEKILSGTTVTGRFLDEDCIRQAIEIARASHPVCRSPKF